LTPLQKLKASPVGLARINAADTGIGWRRAPHLDVLNLALLDVARGENRFLLVFMPPGHAKSTIISEAFPAWLLGTQPNAQIILSTYGQEFSETWGRKARDLVLHYGPVLYGVGVRQDSKSVSEWRIAGRRGVMYSVGVGGQTTGKRADFALIDDPVKNAEEASSEVYREMLYRWFQQTLYTRLTPQGAVVLCMTRWHHDDLAGRLLDDMEAGRGLPWRVLSLPALAEEGDELGRAKGEPLWPALYGRERLAEIQATLSELQWLAMYQQRPTAEAGAVYRREWFDNRYDAPPAHYDRAIMTVDSAFKLGVGSDYTSIQIWAVTSDRYYILHVTNERLEYPELISSIRQLATEYHVAGVYIEDKASGQSAVQTLQRETRLPVIAVPVRMGKEARADGNSPTWRAGRVWLPARAAWVGPFVQQHVQFPRGAHDDMVDAGNIALDTLKYGTVGVQRFNY
jgi:predicted phage terminase large subunit-like protein